MQIALDAMGGDHAPGPIVAGAIRAVQDDPDLRVVLVGDAAQVEPLLAQAGAPAGRVEVLHCTQAVLMDESPVEALRRKPDSSVARCWELLAGHRVEAIVSAGNTGAMVAAGLRLKLFLKNVRRPGIATVMPTLRGPCVMLDVGANVYPKPEHLYQYGVMGSIFARCIFKHEQPRIGLLNVGHEAQKGNELVRDTHALFHSSSLKPQFIGNIEGRDVTSGVCDVIVTDGFVGNVVLKVCEGVFDFIMKVTAKELQSKLSAERDVAMGALKGIVQRYDYHETGGAPLLGIDGICIICHGSSGDRAIKNALGMAASYVRAGLNQNIVQELESMPALQPAGQSQVN